LEKYKEEEKKEKLVQKIKNKPLYTISDDVSDDWVSAL
jgi:hypothetical protein